MISKEAIEEFKKIYKKKHGEELSDYVASEAATRLINIVKLVYRPIPKEWRDKCENAEEKQPKSKKIDLVERYVAEAKINEAIIEERKSNQQKS